jgi:hypothetical protein
MNTGFLRVFSLLFIGRSRACLRRVVLVESRVSVVSALKVETAGFVSAGVESAGDELFELAQPESVAIIASMSQAAIFLFIRILRF